MATVVVINLVVSIPFCFVFPFHTFKSFFFSIVLTCAGNFLIDKSNT